MNDIILTSDASEGVLSAPVWIWLMAIYSTLPEEQKAKVEEQIRQNMATHGRLG